MRQAQILSRCRTEHARSEQNPARARQDNRDKRVELLQRYARKFFPATRYLDYAQRVEAYTLTKAANLVMNVDVRRPWLRSLLLPPVLRERGTRPARLHIQHLK